MNLEKKPKAITNEIVIQEFGDEIIVYNLSQHKAMSLNPTVAAVWQNCNGLNNIHNIKENVAESLSSKVTDEIVFLALDELKRHKLIESDRLLNQVSRRELINKIGLTTALTIPIITSLVVPSAIQASSLTCTTLNQTTVCPSKCCDNSVCTDVGKNIDGCSCVVDTDCLSGCCDNGICADVSVCFV